MKAEIPDTPLALLNTVIYLLEYHRIKISSLEIHPETVYRMYEDKYAMMAMNRFLNDGDDKVYGIPFKQKV